MHTWLTFFFLSFRLAAQVGLRIVGKWGFHQLYYDKCRVDQYRQLQWHMEAVDERGTLSPAEWEVAGLLNECLFALLLRLSH